MEVGIFAGLLMIGYLKDKHLNNKNKIKHKSIVTNKTKMVNIEPKKNEIVINKTKNEKNIIETFSVGKYDLYESLETKEKTDDEKKDDNNNNMTPWIKSKNQNYDEGFQRKLDLFTGDRRCVLKQPKKEVESFAGGKDKQNIYGSQVYTGAYQQNMNAGRYYTNELPFEQKKITPGLGVGYDKNSNHGFQQNIRQYELPKTIDQLRSKTNQKMSYKGKIIQGKSKINARDSEYNFTKFKNTTIFENRPLEKTVGLIKKNRTRPHFELYDSKRSLYKGELMGHENKGISKSEYRSKLNKSKKNNFTNDETRNLKGKVKFDLNKKSYTCNQTKREAQTIMPYEKKLYISNLLKALIPIRHYDDNARKTVKETTIHYDDKNILNLKTGGGKNTSHYTDKARKTIKETTSHYDDKNILNIKVGEKNIMRYKDKPKQTIKETTVHNVKDLLNIKLFKKLPKRTQQSIAKTLKECLLHTPRLGNPTTKVTESKNSYVINIPKLETTLKEILIKDAQLLNVLGKLKHKVYLMDNAKTTHKETYVDNHNIGQANTKTNDGYKVASYDMTDTNRQSTSNKDYYGITGKENCDGYKTSNFEAKETNKETYADKDYYGTTKGDLQSMSYEDIYNATMNEIKETVAVGRPPTIQGPKTSVSSDDVNIKINKNECINTRTPLIKTIINNSLLPIFENDGDNDDKNGYLESTSNRNDAINDAIRANAERDTNLIVQQIESNPLHISII